MTFQKGHKINVGRRKKPCSEETKLKISKALKGKIPWNKGKTGVYSVEIRQKMSTAGSGARKKLWQDLQYRKKVSAARRGLKRSEETKKKISEAVMGRSVSQKTRAKLRKVNKGKHLTEETRRKMSESRRGKYMGEESSQWKGGISSENQRVRSSVWFRLWRKVVFERDNYICQKCGQRGGKLHPHHIHNFSKHSGFRFTIDNGITLCEKCHMEFHNKYGRKNNTKEQLKEFLAKKIWKTNGKFHL